MSADHVLNPEFPNCRRSGFTLLEMVVVIFVLSIVVAVSLPSFISMGESKILSEAKRLASILRYLGDSAISTRENFHLKVDLGEKVVEYNSPDGERSERFDDIIGVELQSRGLISLGEVTVFFGPTGASENLQFHMRDGRLNITVSLNAMSGRVRIIRSEK